MQVKQLRSPSGVNDAAALVAQPVGSGLRVCTPSNLDSSRMRVVRRGVVVEFPGGATARVVRVRLGCFWPELPYQRKQGYEAGGYRCALVRVLA